MEIKRYLGFTDSIKEPRKTKVENILNKSYRYNGNIYNTVEFLCVKLLEGCYLEKEENYQYYKRNGELSKPKTLYKYISPDGKCYFELNKTQYDFVCYLIQNGLNTEEKILAYDKVDLQHLDELKRAEEEEWARQEVEKQKKQEERERIKTMIYIESQNISPEEKELVDNIFISMYGQSNTWNYSLVVLIHNFDDPYCKEEIISRLHNDNKASIKIFECMTGLKLPKSYKERKAYLEGLTQADFKGMSEYKPRKRKEKVEKELFYMAKQTPEGKYCWEKVFAEPITKYSVDMFIFYNGNNWNLSLAESGSKVVIGKTKTECFDKLKKQIDKEGKENFQTKVKEHTEKIKNMFGENPRYKAA